MGNIKEIETTRPDLDKESLPAILPQTVLAAVIAEGESEAEQSTVPVEGQPATEEPQKFPTRAELLAQIKEKKQQRIDDDKRKELAEQKRAKKGPTITLSNTPLPGSGDPVFEKRQRELKQKQMDKT